MAKYEFTDECITESGCTMHRIRALIDFGEIHAGDLGGFIESEENLDQQGNAWVSDDAKVSDNARVSGNALVSGNAWVSGDAKVYENARVSDNALVLSTAEIYGDAHVYEDARVFHQAKVFGSAAVYGRARIFGNAQIYDAARVYGCAVIVDDAQIFGNAQVHNVKPICNNAMVYENAEVYNNASVGGNTKIHDTAKVFGNVTVMDCVEICGDAWVSGGTRVIDNVRICGKVLVDGYIQLTGDTVISDTKDGEPSSSDQTERKTVIWSGAASHNKYSWEKPFENDDIIVRRSEDPNEYDFLKLVFEGSSRNVVFGRVNCAALRNTADFAELQSSEKFIKEYCYPQNLSDIELIAALVECGKGMCNEVYMLNVADDQLRDLAFAVSAPTIMPASTFGANASSFFK